MKTLSLTALVSFAALALTAPVAAQDPALLPSLEEVLAHERRDADRARDQYRHPAETLRFFQVEPTMTVAEYGPSGGWYTRVLAPWLSVAGKYIGFNQDSDRRTYPNRAAEVRAKGWTEAFKAEAAPIMGIEASAVTAFETDEVPEELAGAVDRVLFFRAMHGLNISNRADEVLKAVRVMLKPDGMVGVVQHRAPQGASYDEYGAIQRGYMREADVIAIFVANGFELVDKSEINANPKDPANWENGVWTLPPTLATGAEDPRRNEYLAIGESDRMTLLFRKAR